MTINCKICGISNAKILDYLINHKYAPEFIGFIVNYPKSKRYVEPERLKKLIDVDKKKSKFVAVLVKPNNEILEKVKKLNFDYYQIYDCNPVEIKSIKKKYKIKIISAITVETEKDILMYKEFNSFSDIILFDSKGYEKSLEFDHKLMKNVPSNISRMIAGNIRYDDNLEKFKEICNYIDISGGVDSDGLKDISKIEIFLKKVKKLND